MNVKLYTLKDVAKRIDRDKHTAWHHVKKLGLGTMISNQLLLSEDEYNTVVKKATFYDMKK